MNNIAKVVQKFSLSEQPKEFHYWLMQSETARIEALEQIVREHHSGQPDHELRLQRVCSIAQRS